MFIFGSKDIIGIGTEAQVFDAQTGFFKHFPYGTVCNGFIGLQMPPRKCPGVCAMRIFAFSQQHPAIFDDDNGNAD